VWVSPQAVLSDDSDTPLLNVNRNGMMAMGTLVVAEPAAGLLPIMV
jgi:hypothetical protein